MPLENSIQKSYLSINFALIAIYTLNTKSILLIQSGEGGKGVSGVMEGD